MSSRGIPAVITEIDAPLRSERPEYPVTLIPASSNAFCTVLMRCRFEKAPKGSCEQWDCWLYKAFDNTVGS
jgi:hypothetical protein